MIEDSKKLFQDLNIEINPKEKMKNLTVGKQQMCEIAKAISHKAEVIIFDEPSAALTEKEIADLFEIIRDLRKKNLGIVYISHRMDEIKNDHRPCNSHARWWLCRNSDHSRQYKRRHHQYDGWTCYLRGSKRT